MPLEHNVSVQLTRGEYMIQADVGTGTVTLQADLENLGWQDITDATWSADTIQLIKLPAVPIRAVFTVDAAAALAYVG